MSAREVRCAAGLGGSGLRCGLLVAAVVGIGVMALSSLGGMGGGGGLVGTAVAASASSSATAFEHAQPGIGDRQVGQEGTVIVVRGRGEVSQKPDRATAVFGAQAQAATASDAQRMVNQTVSTAVESIRQLGIDGLVLQTSQLSLHPVYEQVMSARVEREPRIVGYRATTTISARVDDIGEIGKLIDTALQAGANRLDSISFGVADDSGSRRTALASAVKDARGKAEAIAEAMGMRLGEVIDVVEDGATVIQPMHEMHRMQMGAAMAMDMGTPIEAGEVSTVAGVTMRYRARLIRQ